MRAVGGEALEDVGDDHEVGAGLAQADSDRVAAPDLLGTEVDAVVVALFAGGD